MAELKNKYGKHPVYLQMPHDLYVALNTYSAKLGIPRSKVIYNILRGFLGPISSAGEILQDEDGD